MELKEKIKKVDFKSIFSTIIEIHKLVYKTSPGIYISSILVTTTLTLLPYLSTFISAQVIDTLVFNVKEGLGFDQKITMLIIAFTITLLALTLTRSLDTYINVIRSIKIYNFTTLKLTKKISNLDVSHYDDPKLNDIIQKGKENGNFAPLEFYSDTMNILYGTIRGISGIIILSTISPLLIIVLIGFTLPSFIAQLTMGKRKYHIWNADTKVRREYAWTSSYLEQEHSLQDIKAFSLEKYLLNKITKIFEKFRTHQEKAERKRQRLAILTEAISVAGYGIAYFLITKQTLDGILSIGLFTFYISTISALTSSISFIFRSTSRAYEKKLLTDAYFDILNIKPNIIPGKRKVEDLVMPPTIEFKNVSFKYPKSNRYIFKDLSFRIEKGENIAIVGENGAGKSTFVKLICRFYDPTDGEILINGINLKDLDNKEWIKTIAILSQRIEHFHFDVKTNIGMGDVKRLGDLERVKKAAKFSGADSFIKEFEHGYDQILSKRFENGTDPSSGQWQKIALARAYFKDAPMLILDEPTSAIDPKSEAEIFDKLFEYAQEKSVIIISHRFSTIKNAQRIIVMDKGKVIEEGTHEELMKVNGKYKEAFELQKRGFDEAKIKSIKQD